MATKAQRNVKAEKNRPPSRIERVLAKAGDLSPTQRASALAKAGVIKKSEISRVARKLSDANDAA